MKLVLSLVLFIVLVPSLASVAVAEDQPEKPNAAQTADNLRLKLVDIQAKDAELQNKERQLQEDIKPENIERSLAGVGSTKPEELREFRRRQISIELENVRRQRQLLATSRERLEASLRSAEAEAYQQSAAGPSIPLTQMLGAQYTARPRSFVIGAGAIGILFAALGFALVRKFAAAKANR